LLRIGEKGVQWDWEWEMHGVHKGRHREFWA
jgi:hypothetical protein